MYVCVCLAFDRAMSMHNVGYICMYVCVRMHTHGQYNKYINIRRL